ncbi:MAG: isovaleryl-CoA dehydrogenase [Pseudomonadales bacterium]
MSHYPIAEKSTANTHVVENQPPYLENYNMFITDEALAEAVKREGAAWAESTLSEFGGLCGSAERIRWGIQANANRPRLHTHDRYGKRIDEVEFHPSYHQLMSAAIASGVHALPWTQPGEGANVARAALFYLQTQVEAGHLCPITMTFACIPTLKKQANLAELWIPKITSCHYDPRNVIHTEKRGLTIGMAMTEKQGGSDVRRNSTRAFPVGTGGPGEAYELLGHKFFVSAPMCDAFLMLAQAEGGISCFLVPRWRPDGSKNPIQINQLKDKMGNASNASCETDLRGSYGWLIGEEGRGIANILEMVALTRFDCMVGSSAGMRQAVSQITHHCHYRFAFGDKLENQPLMQNVLADLALEAEAAMIMCMRTARALDEAGNNDRDALLVRIATAVGKYWICKRTPAHAYEAMECIGGSALMENSLMPRLYREAPVNSIWEGSGNVQCLDVLRAMQKEPDSLEVFLGEIAEAKGQNKLLDSGLQKLQIELSDGSGLEYRARGVVEKMALAMQAALLIQAGNSTVSDAFCAARLGEESGHVYGMLPKGIDCKALIDRARPTIT